MDVETAAIRIVIINSHIFIGTVRLYEILCTYTTDDSRLNRYNL